MDENIPCSFTIVFYRPAALLKGTPRFIHSQLLPPRLRKITFFLIIISQGKKKTSQGLLNSALSSFISQSLNVDQSKVL